jgi:hypothetical protein
LQTNHHKPDRGVKMACSNTLKIFPAALEFIYLGNQISESTADFRNQNEYPQTLPRAR